MVCTKRYGMLWRIWPARGFEQVHIVRDMLRRLWLVITDADTEPVVLIFAAMFGVIGVTLAQAGNTFDLETFRFISRLVDEQVATVVALSLFALGIISVSMRDRWLRTILSLVYAVVFSFMGITFFLSNPLSTGSVYIVMGIASMWSFIRGLLRE